MKVSLDQVYIQGDDKPAIDAVTKEPVTLKTILLQVCLHESTKPEEKVKRWNIYRSLKKTKEPFILLEAEEVALLKKAVTETHNVLVVGQTCEMLEKPWEPPVKVVPEKPAEGPKHYEDAVNKARKSKVPRNPDDYKSVEG
jgi:hypothetical protein